MQKPQTESFSDPTVGIRLRAWRKQIGANQTRVAEIGGVSLHSQHRYEAGALPPTEYLLRIGEAGADWFWIITGKERLGETLTPLAQQLVEAYMLLPAPFQRALLENAHSLVQACAAADA